jgi:hypothetical protein
MKYLSTLHEYVNEAKQVGILYHYTHLDHLRSILETDTMMQGFEKAISFTRSKRFHHVERFIATQARIVMNGDLLSNNYSFMPYDDGMDAKNFWKGNPLRYAPANEFEERLFTDRPITSITKYIVKVEICKNIYLQNTKDYAEHLQVIEAICAERNIPIDFY